MKRPHISAVINVRNEAKNLNKCLKSISDFADEIIVVDMHSTDGSIEIAKKYGAKLYSYRAMSYVEPARNFALSKATGRWILLLDPDEYLGKTLKNELKNISNRADVDYVKIPRKNIILGKWFRHSNWWPDYLVRFFRRGHVDWKKEIHSQPEVKGNMLTLLDSDKLAIRHNNYTSLSQFVHRALRYSRIQAEELHKQEYKLKTSDFILRPTQEFNSRFFAGQGYRDGWHGLIFSVLQAFAVELIYINLWEIEGAEDKTLIKESFVSASQEATFEYSHWFTKFFKDEYKANPFKFVLVKIRLIFDRLTKNF
ncbi:glycosyltransferase family 2 protein [Candidatus Shapirobacteria bacterium]|nr:glycosyltransferase family 2 protein [Candidatus Shapirobacteria bacterium]